ncbi:putative molybdopterin biosynthesis protein [Paenibacillus sophorae]|uniref:Helix-turn-helix transcriptional regulator n=1 Tax=Paenibacillus sophorae TaxID=1333845 RepID=A0A1H8USE8_9BACL|nr:helix-turn-helix transcriptional regulator [Paenibacillus sophorae]QWU15395.1 helix-turn-helix transcriptional regulator [Paenibacillus sophorae]SEP05917.1 putative molybdopterin biosynthesis protein [Paenibacillus sophorae]
MSDNTLSYSPEEVSKILKISKGTVYDLIKRGELPSYRIGKKLRVAPSDLEAYTRPSYAAPKHQPEAPAVSMEKLILDNHGLIICGQDIVLDVLSRHIEKRNPSIRSLRSYVGSLDGLLSLYRGTANLAAAHLWDGETDEFNIPYVRRLLPGHRCVIVNLVFRNQGFYVAPGNPKNMRSWESLLEPGILFANREKGSGTRIMLDEWLRSMNADAHSIQGYGHEEMSHIAVASAVARGIADVGIGTEKAAQQVSGVDFIPLKKERYDLVFYKEDMDKPHFQALLATLRSPEFKHEVSGLGGYDTSRCGEIVGEV